MRGLHTWRLVRGRWTEVDYSETEQKDTHAQRDETTHPERNRQTEVHYICTAVVSEACIAITSYLTVRAVTQPESQRSLLWRYECKHTRAQVQYAQVPQWKQVNHLVMQQHM